MRLISPALILLCSLISGTPPPEPAPERPHAKALFIPATDPGITYSGRIDSTYGAVNLYWSGTSVQIQFEGQSISGIFQDESGNNYYNVLLDEDSLYTLRPGTSRATLPLASNLSKGPHTVKLFKRTEWDRGKTTFYGFQIEGKPRLLPREAPKTLKMEFYGNSITAGYAVEDLSGKDRPDSIFTNNYLSYAAITARHFDAEYRCICKSGIGILVSWFPLIMPELYDRLIPSDPESHWDFSPYTPDVVVINLFQNDSWLVNLPDHAQFKARFGNRPPTDDQIISAYADFVKNIRSNYPEAAIVCMLGNMDITRAGSPWPGYVAQAVEQLADPRIYTHFVPYKNTPGHPSIAEQEALANSLIDFIEANIL